MTVIPPLRIKAVGLRILARSRLAILRLLDFPSEMRHIKRILQVILRLLVLLVCSRSPIRNISDIDFAKIGTGVTVAGIFSFNMLGSLSVNYTLDGFSSIQSYTVQATSTRQKQTPNFILFKNNSLTSGNHTLLMQVTSCVDQVFELDYILYNASFSTLASKPSLPTISLTQSSSHFSTSTSTAAAQNTNTKSSTHAATIVGSVVGVVGFLLIILVFLFRNRLFNRANPSPSTQTSGTFLSHYTCPF
jgi:hypothetical protein